MTRSIGQGRGTRKDVGLELRMPHAIARDIVLAMLLLLIEMLRIKMIKTKLFTLLMLL